MQSLHTDKKPHGDLSRFVNSFHQADTCVPTLTFEAPPSGYPLIGHTFRGELSVALQGRHFRFSAPQSNYYGQIARDRALVKSHNGYGLAVAEFTATGFYQMFGVAIGKLEFQFMPLARVLPDFAATFDRAMIAARTETQRFAALQSVLETQLGDLHPVPDFVHAAVQRIEAAEGALRISDLYSELDVSDRHLTTIFTDIVGLSPKFFARVRQFNHIARLVLSGDRPSLAEMAAEAGYTDQSHMTKAFQEFVFNSPQKFLNSDFSRVLPFMRLMGRTADQPDP